jgi:hypothetical protein
MHKANLTHNHITIHELYLNNGKIILGLPCPRLRLQTQRGNDLDDTLQQKDRLIDSAPEIRKGYCYGKSSDIWNLGLIFLQLATGRLLEE